MGRKKVNVANIGNLSNDNFYKVKKLCAKAEKLESIIEALQDYKDLITSSVLFHHVIHNSNKESEKIEVQIEAFENEYEQTYREIQKLLKK